MHFHIITLFPDVCRSYTDASVLGRAQKTEKGKGAKVRGKKIQIDYYDPRDFTSDKHRKVDGKPYGGGPGMVMQAEPIIKAWQKAVGRKRNQATVATYIMSPRGEVFTQSVAKKMASSLEHIVLICGRYEGIDERVGDVLNAKPISVGEYILTGGELPALTIVDAVARQIPGVLGTFASLEDERATSGKTYTRPEVIKHKQKEYKVPQVLLDGNHKDIDEWRTQ